MRWAEAGSDRVPNSFRSPPAQKARPSPRTSTLGDAGVGRGHGERLDQLVAHAGVERIQAVRPGQGDDEGVVLAFDPDPGSVIALEHRAGGRPALQASNSGPD